MSKVKNWTAEELSILDESWGYTSIAAIASKLGRSVNAVKLKASRTGLGSHLHSGTCITFSELLKALGLTGSYSERLHLMTAKGLKIKKHKVNNCSFRVVDIEHFWKFAEKNRELFDFSRFGKNSLGIEPEWADIKRQEDIKKNLLIKPPEEKWTQAEDRELIRLLKMHRYGYAELEERLHRTSGAIQRRIIDLGLKERPVKADNHNKWTDEQKALLEEMILNGSSYTVISRSVGKSSKAVRGYVGRIYGSEKLDIVRKRIKSL